MLEPQTQPPVDFISPMPTLPNESLPLDSACSNQLRTGVTVVFSFAHTVSSAAGGCTLGLREERRGLVTVFCRADPLASEYLSPTSMRITRIACIAAKQIERLADEENPDKSQHARIPKVITQR